MRQSNKNNHSQRENGEFNISATYELGQNVLDIPLKKSKQISEILELQGKQHKILQKMDTKNMKSISQDFFFRPTPKQTLQNNQAFESNPKSTSSYIVGCIMRSFRFRKLSVEDIADIFRVKADVVEEIDKFRILRDFDAGNQRSNSKLEAMKMDIMSKLQQGFGNVYGLKNGLNYKGLKGEFPSQRKKRSRNLSTQSPIVQEQPPQASSIELSPTQPHLFQHTSQFPEPQSPFDTSTLPSDIFEYQRLLRQRPPYRMDHKIIALVDILKKRPQMTQKDMIKVLEEEYGIKDMHQAAVSRGIKRIYDMQNKVGIILQAQRDGFVVL